MTFSASTDNHNPNFIYWDKPQVSSTVFAFLPPLLDQVPHFDNADSHAEIDNNQDVKVISWEDEPTTYLVSATSFRGIHIPFCNLCVGIVKFLVLRFPFVDCFPGGCSNT